MSSDEKMDAAVFSIPRQVLGSFLPNHRSVVEFERMISSIRDASDTLEELRGEVKSLESRVFAIEGKL